jgi:hypothetical protein
MKRYTTIERPASTPANSPSTEKCNNRVRGASQPSAATAGESLQATLSAPRHGNGSSH